jgi:hypothetical protein
MLSQISLADVAVNSRDRARVGASITYGGEKVLRDRALARSAAATSAPCLRPNSAAVHYGSGATEAGQVEFTWRQRTDSNFTHTTRVAMADGGALGSHPARDPV